MIKIDFFFIEKIDFYLTFNVACILHFDWLISLEGKYPLNKRE